MHAAALLLTAILAAEPLGPGDHARTLEFGGRTRSYIVHVPPKHDPKQPTPVVLAFHGAMTNGPERVRAVGEA